jgi:hypothetical protein
MKHSKMDFTNKIKNQVETQKEKEKGRNYGYLRIPKGVDVYSIEFPKKLETIKVKFDIIPYVITDEKHPDLTQGAEIGSPWWRRPIRVHKNIGVENTAYICPTTFGKKCPICDYKKKLAGEKSDKDTIKALNYSLRSIYIVKPKEDSNYEDDYHIFDISDFCFFDPLMIDVEEQNEHNFPSLDDGKTLQVRFNKESFNNNNFPKASRISFLEREEQYEDSVLDEVPNLDEILVVLPYKELEAKFLEMDEEETTTDKEVVDDEPKDDETTWDDLKEMSQSKLIRLIKEKELDIDIEDYDDDLNAFRKVIAKKLDIEIPVKKEGSHKETEKTMTRTISRKETKPSKEDNNDCPHGHTFGKDCEKSDDCNDCESWEKCMDENDKK